MSAYDLIAFSMSSFSSIKGTESSEKSERIETKLCWHGA